FYLTPGLQPHVPTHAPLLIEWVGKHTLAVIAAARWHVWNPRGAPYTERPADEAEARARFAERWEPWPHTLGQPRYITKTEPIPGMPATLDLRLHPTQSPGRGSYPTIDRYRGHSCPRERLRPRTYADAKVSYTRPSLILFILIVLALGSRPRAQPLREQTRERERRKRNEKDDFGQPRREKPIRRKTVGNRPRPSATCPLPPWFASSPDV